MEKIKSKRCSKCKRRLSIEKFSKNSRYCKECRKSYMKEYDKKVSSKKYSDENYKLKLGVRNICPKGK